MLVEFENPILLRTVPDARWGGVMFAFAGVNDRGEDLRVGWFPGAQAP